MIVIFFSTVLIVFLGIIFLITTIQQNQAKKLLYTLSGRNLEHLRISFHQTQLSEFTAVGGLPIKAEMYFDRDLILITPKKNGLFNGMFNFNLPLIFTDKVFDITKLVSSSVVIRPCRIKFTDGSPLRIRYEKSSIGKIKYDIIIKNLDKKDKDKFNLIKEIDVLSVACNAE